MDTMFSFRTVAVCKKPLPLIRRFSNGRHIFNALRFFDYTIFSMHSDITNNSIKLSI